MNALRWLMPLTLTGCAAWVLDARYIPCDDVAFIDHFGDEIEVFTGTTLPWSNSPRPSECELGLHGMLGARIDRSQGSLVLADHEKLALRTSLPLPGLELTWATAGEVLLNDENRGSGDLGVRYLNVVGQGFGKVALDESATITCGPCSVSLAGDFFVADVTVRGANAPVQLVVPEVVDTLTLRLTDVAEAEVFFAHSAMFTLIDIDIGSAPSTVLLSLPAGPVRLEFDLGDQAPSPFVSGQVEVDATATRTVRVRGAAVHVAVATTPPLTRPE